MTRAVQKTPGKESGSWSRRPDLRRIGKRSGAGWISALVLLALTAAGCASLQPDKTTPAARHDTAVRNEKIRGLNFEILDSCYQSCHVSRIQRGVQWDYVNRLFSESFDSAITNL